ncbi:restriction alleviation protein, Lar family [Croceicoccus ponticola]|uniref:Restriction alleviation protein, Lar family n=1 Tax=Croceicoccus ponticola TaxID=2217664 RepID=A0A437GUB4_9SPHN|nr:restriction alleviation protein, Lar family [Croceicoccus ponticola]
MSDPKGSCRRLPVSTATDLAACPFCASINLGFYEHVYAKHFAVICNLCGAEGPSRPTREEAGTMWNRRVHE